MCAVIGCASAQNADVDSLAEVNAPSKPIVFNDEELAWIKKHQRLTVGADNHFPPFEYENSDGNIVGLAIAYLDLVAEETGLHFEVKHSNRWQALMEQASVGKIDLMSGAVPTPQRREKFYFTQPYAVFPSVIATRDDAHFVGSMRNLIGKKVAVVEGFFEEDILRNDYPKLKLVTFPTRREALYAVSTGEAYAYIGNLAIISYLIRSENFDNLQIAAPTPFNRIGLSMASTDPVLIGIIDKVLANVSPERRNSLEQEWIAVRFQEVEYLVFGKIGAGMLLVTGLAMAWVFSLKVQIRKRRRTEEQIILAKAQAERAKTQAEHAKARAEEANARKSEFMGIAAHDLKNPLGSIRGLSEMMKEDLQATENSPPALNDQIDTLETIRSAADHMLELVEELLDVEALESGAGQIESEYVSLHSILDGVVEFNRHAAAKKGIDLKYACSVEKPITHGDVGRIREILDNLVNNAVKYTPSGGVVQVWLDFVDGENMLRVTVQDEGPGLTDDDLKKLYGRFSRGSARPTGGESSTGLGLSIVKLMIEELGGVTWAENRIDRKGSLFYADFPRYV
ncbi:transporter substrate-binding domain-containing protein [Cerasicoccus frondis]|uniref:transporter substrate-binding domain-containing protein n=1 Tax=Cerasicoccus frondis TaxID=490090 RepID=UPI002852938F|nr:transporter substrate-binding domain-containing protein [Cerasicoccus frondis]